MAIQINIKTGRGVKGMKVAVKGARDSALHDVALYWAREILPEHFKNENSARYGMKKRTEAHKRRKRREGRPADPNVYTGRLKEKMLGTRPEVTVNSGGVKLVWRGLPRHTFITSSHENLRKLRQATGAAREDRYLNDPKKSPEHKANIVKWRERKKGLHVDGVVQVHRPDKVKELTAVDVADERKLARKFREYFNAAMKRITGK